MVATAKFLLPPGINSFSPLLFFALAITFKVQVFSGFRRRQFNYEVPNTKFY